jgi:hypothetical protein
MADIHVNTLRFPEQGSLATCACADRTARFKIDGKEFIGQFDGSISVRVGTHKTDGKGTLTMPLTIVGYSTTSDIPGLGKTTLNFDFSRPVLSSQLKTQSSQGIFPAVQTMRLNILLTTEGLPGVTLASENVGVLINKEVNSFPPSPGSTYTLQKPVKFSAIDGKNNTKVQLLEINTSIKSTDVDLKELIVGNGVLLYPQSESFSNIMSRFSEEMPITFGIDRKSVVDINILNTKGNMVIRILAGEREPGRHTITVDGSYLKGKEYYYQIQVDGQDRTAKMLLVRS